MANRFKCIIDGQYDDFVLNSSEGDSNRVISIAISKLCDVRGSMT